MAILIDSSILIADAFEKDANHLAAKRFIAGLGREVGLVAIPVLSEVFYMVTIKTHYLNAVNVFEGYADAFAVEQITNSDRLRMQQIMRQYADAELDFVDTAIMAVSERLNITRIATFDRRDFSMVRPTHTDHYDLLP